MNHKDTALNFLRQIMAGNIRQAYRDYTLPGLRHHNAYYPATIDSLVRGMEDNHAHFPDKLFETKNVIGEGPLVAVHSLMRFNPAHPGVAVVHLFRFEGDKIAEFWDVAQLLPDESPNENGPL